jgi:hypothetical protein
MEVSGQLHVPAALPTGKEPLVPIGEEAIILLNFGLNGWKYSFV